MITISGYQITTELYASANSLVYRGHQLADYRPVILKVLREDYPSPQRIARFRREYEITRSLGHSSLPLSGVARQLPSTGSGPALAGVVQAYSLDQNQQRWMMVMEDFGGESLVRLGVAGRLSLADFLTLAIKVADILGQIHQRQIIHKDINPSNIVAVPPQPTYDLRLVVSSKEEPSTIPNPTRGTRAKPKTHGEWQVKIIDFGISTALPRENPTFRNPEILEGTLAYISPEQTGRMNRAIDYRTDFYSLGVTFYELLTGQLPFPPTDALELVHYHMAQQPAPLHQVRPEIPPLLSDIVLKLMAKNAEDRYQSAYGLKADLTECLQQWQNNARIELFSLGQHDTSDRFQLPQKLYGREREIASLLVAFERVAGTKKSSGAEETASRGGEERESSGAEENFTDGIPPNAKAQDRKSKIEMMLVSGYAGIGKSALIHELYKPITYRRGYFISGKFDQFQRHSPYTALIQAFRSLVRELLTEREAEIAAWREKLLAALGPNGRVISEVMPEAELIIGPQPEVPDLPPAETENRFNLTLQSFIQVFTRPEHPLVIFLDDLQWADGASLKLIERLMTASGSEYLFLIGAYRDNEVVGAHPLRLTLAAIEQAGARINHISLAPLDLPHVNHLIADMFACEPQQAHDLAELVLAKTAGNPFFINEFLKSLYSDSLIIFDHTTPGKGGGGWRWDLGQIRARAITDNVVELLAGKVQQLPEASQQVLKLAACIGNRFELKTLALVAEQSPSATAAALWPELTAGLVLPLEDNYKLMMVEVPGLADELTAEYKFAHDRIQQAAYSLLSEKDRQAAHWRIGHLLLRGLSPEEQEQHLFDLTDQLNLGRALLTERSEQDELAALNLRAGQRAKASAAYQAAFAYLKRGIELLAADSWLEQYDLSLGLHVEAAEAAYLSGRFEDMERLAEVVLLQARTLLDQVQIYEIKIQAYQAQNKLREALDTALTVLRLLGVNLPAKPGKPDILLGLAQVKWALLGKRIEDFANLPAMTDLTRLAAMRLLPSVGGAAIRTVPELLPLVVFKLVILSVKHGNTSGSAFGYAAYGMILCGILGDINGGYRFGQLALDLLERLNAKELKAKTFMMVGGATTHWEEHLKETLELFQEGYQSGLETGDAEFVGYNAYLYAFHAYFCGKELGELEDELAAYTRTIRQFRQETSLYLLAIYHQTILNLLDGTGEATGSPPCRLSGKSYDEEEVLPLLLEAKDGTALCDFYLNKLILCYLFQEYAQAVENAVQAEKYLENMIGKHTVPVFHFYDSLARLALFPGASQPAQRQILKKVGTNQKKLKKWLRYGPMNLSHKFYLVEAELARVLGREGAAREYYDQAITAAQENEYLNEEALACELAGRFYLERRQIPLARHYLRNAHYAYRRWGALAKVKDLETRYPQLLAQATQEFSLTTFSTGQRVSSSLDLTSVLKASQAISSEIVLDRLLTTLMKIVIENAGAQSGYLILDKNGQPAGDQASRWVIEARGEINQPEVTALQSAPVSTSEELAVTIVNYVARTRESVVLDDASHEGIFTQDPYILRVQPKSILCMPLLNQGKLNGIIYLENNLATAAFTPDRLQVLTLLSGQAAISVENAGLYTRQVELTNAASRFIPHGFLAFLQKTNIVDVKLGDQVQRNMAILVSDIRSFTTLSEKMTPQANFDFVNTYLGHVSPIISQHNGLIVKYMGDGIMAVFPGQVEDGLNAALAQQKQVARYNVERRQQGEVPIQIGIGLHAGTMMLGTVGETQRMQLDLFSDTVNSAARLEGLTKRFGVGLVISAEAIAQLKDPTLYHLRFLGKVPVKGRQKMLSVFEVFDSDPDEIVALKLETRIDFEKGLSLYYDWQFAEAQVYFEQVLQRFTQDKAAQFYLQQMAELMDARPAPTLEFSASE